MTPKIKNIIIFVGIGVALVLIYVFFFRGSSTSQAPLVTTSGGGATSTLPGTSTADNSQVSNNFLTLLLSVKSIQLNDSILSNPAFMNLHDSSITLTPDNNPGRPNPFAPIGNDNVVTSTPPLVPPLVPPVTLPATTGITSPPNKVTPPPTSIKLP